MAVSLNTLTDGLTDSHPFDVPMVGQLLYNCSVALLIRKTTPATSPKGRNTPVVDMRIPVNIQVVRLPRVLKPSEPFDWSEYDMLLNRNEYASKEFVETVIINPIVSVIILE